jgi:glycosyltransferase involved in cell wall biosynthesis
MVILESGLAGRPVIVTDLGGAPEAVLDGVTGLVVSPTEERFACAMARAADPTWRDETGAAALLHVEAEFSRARFAQRMFAEWAATTRSGPQRGCRHSRE